MWLKREIYRHIWWNEKKVVSLQAIFKTERNAGKETEQNLGIETERNSRTEIEQNSGKETEQTR